MSTALDLPRLKADIQTLSSRVEAAIGEVGSRLKDGELNYSPHVYVYQERAGRDQFLLHFFINQQTKKATCKSAVRNYLLASDGPVVVDVVLLDEKKIIRFDTFEIDFASLAKKKGKRLTNDSTPSTCISFSRDAELLMFMRVSRDGERYNLAEPITYRTDSVHFCYLAVRTSAPFRSPALEYLSLLEGAHDGLKVLKDNLADTCSSLEDLQKAPDEFAKSLDAVEKRFESQQKDKKAKITIN